MTRGRREEGGGKIRDERQQGEIEEGGGGEKEEDSEMSGESFQNLFFLNEKMNIKWSEAPRSRAASVIYTRHVMQSKTQSALS